MELVLYLAKPKLLFLKPRKVAGTSFEIALSVSATTTDIITPISLPDELVRVDQNGQLPVNWSRSAELEATYVALVQQFHRLKRSGIVSDELKAKRQQIKDLVTTKGHRIYYNHIVPAEIKLNFGEAKFAEAFKITITRHPYEQLVSQAFWLHQGKKRRHLPISQIIDEILTEPAPNLPYYFDQGEPVCDMYIKMENFQSDVQDLENKFGLTIWKYLPVTKKSSKGVRPKADEILSPSQKIKIQSRSIQEFEFFKYLV